MHSTTVTLDLHPFVLFLFCSHDLLPDPRDQGRAVPVLHQRQEAGGRGDHEGFHASLGVHTCQRHH